MGIMDAQRREAITDWPAQEFTDGFAGLRRFADRGVSGAVTDGSGWLFLFDGRVVGTVDADIDSFADADGTVYEAPDRSLSALFAMREHGGRERAQYYTEDTPLADADQTLSDGGFTGYIKLSENVLSGDYYVVYTAGESMAAAFVGNARRLETGEDAFALAADEVGIYTVYEVDLDVEEIPRSAGTTSDGSSTATTATDESATEDDKPRTGGDELATEGDGRTPDDVVSDPSPAGETLTSNTPKRDATQNADTTDTFTTAAVTDTAEPDDSPDQTEDKGAAPATETSAARSNRYDIPLDADWTTDPEAVPATEPVEDTAAPHASADHSKPDEPENEADPSDDRGDTAKPAAGTKAADSDDENEGDGDELTTGAAAEGDDAESKGARSDDEDNENMGDGDELTTGATAEGDDAESERARSDDKNDVFSAEAAWREAASTPTLESTAVDGDTEAGTDDPAPASEAGHAAGGAADFDEPARGHDEVAGGPASASVSAADEPTATQEQSLNGPKVGESPPEDRLRELRSALASVTSERDDAIARRDAFRTRYEQIANERDELVDDREELRATVEELRSEVTRLREELTTARNHLPDSDEQLSPAAALDGTNLFIRYGSRTGATLEAAHDGERDRSELQANLRIEHHTSFETDGLTVKGEPYESFLHGTIAYRFTRWLTEDLLFETAATGNAGALRDLYDALPELNRAELGGSVSVVHRENGEEVHEERSFDLVFRDRMGNPLFVAELNDSRSSTGGSSIESLVANGETLAASNDSFAGAFSVTASFFEPDALEVADDAVGGGLLSRSKKKGFVKLTRKRGYHLCLVESRDGEFHLTLPNL
jgi:hypothetical protein